MVEKLPVESLEDGILGWHVRLANGSQPWTLIGNFDVTNPRAIQHCLTLSIDDNGKWFRLARYFDTGFPDEGPEALARFLGLHVDDVFPIAVAVRRYVGTDHLYPAARGQRSVVRIGLTGSRRADDKLANEAGGFTEKPEGYMWHHVDDFDPQSGISSLELVDKKAHSATNPHTGSVAQYEKHHGIRYKR